jgi:hypothetical protein
MPPKKKRRLAGMEPDLPADLVTELPNDLAVVKHIAPLGGFLHLDSIGDKEYVLTNTITQEIKRFSGLKYELCISDDDTDAVMLGFSCNADDDDPEPTLVQGLYDDLFKEQVMLADDGNVFLRKINRDASHDEFLPDRLSRHEEADVILSVGALAADVSFCTYVMAIRRGSLMRIFWPCQKFYMVFRLQCYLNTPSKWVNRRQDLWSRELDAVFGECVLFSKHGLVSGARKDRTPLQMRCLPQTCMSSVAMLFMLGRWSGAPKEAGGFDDQSGASKRAVFELLAALVRVATSNRAVQAEIFDDLEWRAMWPRPQTAKGMFNSVTLTINMDGKVDIASMRGCEHSTVFKEWSELVDGKCGNCDVLAIDIMRACGGYEHFEPFLAQLAYALAVSLEHNLLTIAKARPKRDPGMTHMRLRPFTEDMSSSNDLSSKLSRYVLGCVAESQKFHIYGVAVDKATPCKQTLSNGAILFPSGVAAIMVPQVVGSHVLNCFVYYISCFKLMRDQLFFQFKRGRCLKTLFWNGFLYTAPAFPNLRATLFIGIRFCWLIRNKHACMVPACGPSPSHNTKVAYLCRFVLSSE